MRGFFCFLILCINVASAKPYGMRESSRIIESLQKLEMIKRTGKGRFELSPKMFDYLHRKSFFMSVEVNEIQTYVYENRKNTKAISSFKELFELSMNSQNRKVTKRMIETLLGLIIRLDKNRNARFKVKATEILEAVKKWEINEIKELVKLLKEVATEAESYKSSPNSEILKIINPVYHEQFNRKCL